MYLVNVKFGLMIFPYMLDVRDDAGSILRGIGIMNFDRSATILGTDAPNYASESHEFGAMPVPKAQAHYSDQKRYVIRHLRIVPDGGGPGWTPNEPPSIEIVEA